MGLFHSPSPVMAEGKTHLSLVVCGHVDAGKSTTTGHLLFELGGISEREMEKLKEKAAQLGKSSFSFAFYLDTQKDERERGVTISCTTKEFFTDKYHYTIIDAPGHRDFIKNMISGAGQADVALLMVPADKGGFEKAVAKGNRATGEIEGQTRQHSRLINLLGVEKVIVGINKMDNTSPTPYLQSRFDEIAGEELVMLKTAGYKEDKIKKEFPFIPISGWEGDNLVKETEKMPWYKGIDLVIDGANIHVDTLKDCFNDACFPPKRTDEAAMRTCVSGVYKIKGVGDVITGRVEQGAIIKESKVKFTPSDGKMPCRGKVSPSRCTTSRSSVRWLATTSVSTSRVSARRTCPVSMTSSATRSPRSTVVASAPLRSPVLPVPRCSSSRSTGRWARSPPVVPRSRVPSSSRRTTWPRSCSPRRARSS